MGILDFFKGKNADNGRVENSEDLLKKIEIIPGLKICQAFVPYWSKIEKTRLSYISIVATPVEDLALEESKFGHYPYMPIDFEYPKDAEGKFMYPLAQINCKELPVLQGYPTSGYLQFYISAFDDVYGLNFDDPQAQKNFRVLYFMDEEIVNYKADFSFLDEAMESDKIPIYKPHALKFFMKDEYVGIGDVRHEENKSFNLFDIISKFPAIENELEASAYDSFLASGHKIGGYSYFTQEDPRRSQKAFRDNILLFQIDSDKEIMWGDAGVANFFIHRDDLIKKDFSKVFYNWDCT